MSDLRIITEPMVSVICRPELNEPALALHLNAICPDRDLSQEYGYSDPVNTQFGDALPEVAGRLCYRSWTKPRPGGNAAYLQHIKEVGHGSVLEHGQWSFLISGISRTLSHELVRHRAGVAISQVSQRYVDESDVAFVVPPARLPDYEAWQTWTAAANADENDLDERLNFERGSNFAHWRIERRADLTAYRRDVERLTAEAPAELTGTERRKWARQAARDGLPGCTETAMVWSANARALRHCIEMRASAAADVEIRRLFVAVLRLMQVESPNLFCDYTITRLPDGTEAAETPHRKV